MEPFNLTSTPLQGVNLIEASAGTGKTYTIAGLYLRLLLEGKLEVGSIVVVTFTEAATAELRERIRNRLVEAESALRGGQHDDIITPGGWAESESEREQAGRRLRQAILSFDRAVICTIHGFCQRTLRDNAFESGGLFEQELLADQSELLLAVADDFWRSVVQTRSGPAISLLQERNCSPEVLLGWIRVLLNHPSALPRRSDQGPALEEAEAAYRSEVERVRAEWARSSDEVSELLRHSPALNRTSYRLSKVEALLEGMESLLASPPATIPEPYRSLAASKVGRAKKGHEPVTHPFFNRWEALLDASNRYAEAGDGLVEAITLEAHEWIRHELQARKQQAGLLSYDDMLHRVEEALRGGGGAELARRVGERFKAALIDEFQDTDPLQYNIFKRLFAESRALFLVGDPKQAIYSFRGADLFAYLKAQQEAASRYTLNHNWRSVEGVIQGCNALFTNAENPFLYEKIGFDPARQAEQGGRPALTGDGRLTHPFHLVFLPKGEQSKVWSKDSATDIFTRYTATEIVRLLRGGAQKEIEIGDRPLRAGDIAVLVRTHLQGERMHRQLRAQGVRSVLRSRQQVFASREAVELERFLRAVAQPRAAGLLRSATVTRLVGGSAETLEKLSRDEGALESLVLRYSALREQWRRYGFYSMFLHWLERDAVAERVLACVDGERQLTNLYHLAELLNRHDRSEHPAPEALLQWLSVQRGAVGEEGEAELRLESEENLVQIVTIHSSKGLEYPVVFCPFLWDGKMAKGQAPILYHDPEMKHRPVVDFGSENLEEAKCCAWREELAENMRLLYVAITRARQRCYLAWGSISGSGASPLGLLLHPLQTPPSDDPGCPWDRALQQRLNKLGDQELLEPLQQLVEENAAAIGMESIDPDLPAPRFNDQSAERQMVAARTLRRPLQAHHRLTSFTALTQGLDGGGHPSPGEADRALRQEPSASGHADILAFPRGARAGSCLHHLFEKIDFSRQDASSHLGAARASLQAFGFDAVWAEGVAEMAGEVLSAPLDESGLTLSSLPEGARRSEMAFYYPLGRLDRARLSALLRKHWPEMPDAYDRRLDALDFGEVEGYMHGFIDLIFEAGGRYYIVDYKSNYLGDGPDDYTPAQLTQEIARHGYFLQYLFYALALHRYLAQRLPEYSYDTHFGGVYYLFLRGMSADGAAGNGIYRRRPGGELIGALERLASLEA